jgi:hypothetical protein
VSVNDPVSEAKTQLAAVIVETIQAGNISETIERLKTNPSTSS